MLIELLKAFILRGTYSIIIGEYYEGQKSYWKALEIIDRVSHDKNSPESKYFQQKAELAATEKNNKHETVLAAKKSITAAQLVYSDDEITLAKESSDLESIATLSDEELKFANNSIRPLIKALLSISHIKKAGLYGLSKYSRAIYDEISLLINQLFELKEGYRVAKLSTLTSEACQHLMIKSIKLIYAIECVSFFPKKYPARDFLQALLLEAYLLRDNISQLSSKNVFSYSMKISGYYSNLAAAYTEIDLFNQAMKKEYGQTLHRYPKLEQQEQENLIKHKKMMHSLDDNAKKYRYLHHHFECKRQLYYFEKTTPVNEKAKNFIRVIDEIDNLYQCASVGYVPFFNLLCKIGSLVTSLSIPDAQLEELLCTDLAKHLLRLSQIYGDVYAKLPMKNAEELPESSRPEHLASLFNKCYILVNLKREELQNAIDKANIEKAKLETAAAITAIEYFFSGDGLDSKNFSLHESTTPSSESTDRVSDSLNSLLVFDDETYSPSDPVSTVNPSDGNLVLSGAVKTELPEDALATVAGSIKDVAEMNKSDLHAWVDYLTGNGGLFPGDQCKRKREQISGIHYNGAFQQGIEQGAVSPPEADLGHVVKKERGMLQPSC